MSASVHFKGIDNVLNAYEQRAVPAWSLWQGSQFLFKYEGNDISEGATALNEILDRLAQSSNAIYTLKVYEELQGGKIKDKTPHDGSFNFKLNLDSQEITTSQYGALRNQNAILEKLERLEQRMNEREEEEEEEEPKSKLGLIGEILNDPGISQIVMPLVSKLLGINGANTPRPTIAGINDDEAATLKQAIEILKKSDPDLPAHLMKLAKLSQESPDSFKFLLNALEGM